SRHQPCAARRQRNRLVQRFPDLVGKGAELLKLAVPLIRRVAVLWEPGAIGGLSRWDDERFPGGKRPPATHPLMTALCPSTKGDASRLSDAVIDSASGLVLPEHCGGSGTKLPTWRLDSSRLNSDAAAVVPRVRNSRRRSNACTFSSV